VEGRLQGIPTIWLHHPFSPFPKAASKPSRQKETPNRNFFEKEKAILHAKNQLIWISTRTPLLRG
jgi:hypothetical protein|tara:strand:- start:1770 stop:1964 length:195 start_codon:yes stop_codon:yes gene_type:complete